MKLYPHQERISKEAYEILKQYGLVYLGMEERTGKSLTAIHIAEISNRQNILILTKKKALEGWHDTLSKYTTNGTKFTVTNYHAVHKAHKGKTGKRLYKLALKPSDYDLIILDEAHNYLSSYPKPGVIWKSVKKLCTGQPIIYLSATPNAQGYQLLYNQLALSDWSPFKKYPNFYRWFEYFGIPHKIRTSYGLQETYSKCKDIVWREAKHLFITYTRKELDFEHEPEDVVHFYELDEETKKLYNNCLEDLVFDNGDLEFLLDSSRKLRTTLHQLEGGVAKDMENYHILPNGEKIRAILEDFGDSERNVLMYHYKAEKLKLERVFKHTRLLQGTSYAEGVDLSMYDNLIIYSQDFSTSRHSQRRARQANMNRTDPIKVHFYLVEGGISAQVYKTVSVNKTNFIDSMFFKETL